MGLSHELISMFAKTVNNNKTPSSATTVYGTVKSDAAGNKYVKLDGTDQITPLDEENTPFVDTTLANANVGDRVAVTIKDHTATVTGNVSAPSASDKDIKTSINNFDTAIGDKLQANQGYFKELIADKAELGNVVAAILSVAELIATKATIDELITKKLTVEDLIAEKVDADIITADTAIIDSLKANNADILSLIATKARIEDLLANNITVDDLITKKLDADWANIEIADITVAKMKELYGETGLINSVTAEDLTVTDYLHAVKIIGDLIEAGTLKADRLVVKGEDGLYYKLNIDGLDNISTSQASKFVVTTSEPEDWSTNYKNYYVINEDVYVHLTDDSAPTWTSDTYYKLDSDSYSSGLDGTAIIAKSVTADKISVTDLMAFGATIGGFKINNSSINTVGKDSVDAFIPGVYLDNEGQVVFGDGRNFLKFIKRTDDDTKFNLSLGIKSDNGLELGFGEQGLNVDGINENNVALSTTITNNGINVKRDDTEVLTANDEGVVATDLHAKTFLKVGDFSRFETWNGRTACFWTGN